MSARVQDWHPYLEQLGPTPPQNAAVVHSLSYLVSTRQQYGRTPVWGLMSRRDMCSYLLQNLAPIYRMTLYFTENKVLSKKNRKEK
jgi:hypothetical protein